MRTCLLAISDGRDEVHARSWASLREMLPDVDYCVTVDDRAHALGFAGAIQEGWRRALAHDVDYIWHAELDFIYHHPVPLRSMIALLQRHPRLVQVALKRQPVNHSERAHGGIVQADPAAFEERRDGLAVWTVHRKFFTTNPSVYPRWIAERGWPQRTESEGHFGLTLLGESPYWQSAFWGGKFDPPLVEHIGHVRTGTGY